MPVTNVTSFKLTPGVAGGSKNKSGPDWARFISIKLVRMRGLEPPRCHHHRLLRPARLPVPPHPRTESDLTNASVECQATHNLTICTSISSLVATEPPVVAINVAIAVAVYTIAAALPPVVAINVTVAIPVNAIASIAATE